MEGDGEEGDSWTSHPYFAGFQRLYPDIITRAAQSKWLLCLPQPASIAKKDGTVVCTTDVLRSHILMKSPYFKNGYQTVHGKNVRFSGDGSITTITRPGLDGVGFGEARRVKVLHDETVYDDECRSFRVLHIQQPLEGASQLQPLFEDMYDEDRSFSAWLQQLQGFASEPGLVALRRQCKSLGETYSHKRPSHARIAKFVESNAHAAAQQLMFGGAFAAAGHGYRQYVLETALQSYAHRQMYSMVWDRVCRESAEDDARLRQHLLVLAHNPRHARKVLGLGRQRMPDTSRVGAALRNLDTCRSPLAKVDCLKRAFAAICAVHAGSGGETGEGSEGGMSGEGRRQRGVGGGGDGDGDGDGGGGGGGVGGVHGSEYVIPDRPPPIVKHPRRRRRRHTASPASLQRHVAGSRAASAGAGAGAGAGGVGASPSTAAGSGGGSPHKPSAPAPTLSSDELLPMLMWSIIMCVAPSHQRDERRREEGDDSVERRVHAPTSSPAVAWHANLQYLHHFLGNAQGQRAFCITTFHASVTFLSTTDMSLVPTASSPSPSPSTLAPTSSSSPGDASVASPSPRQPPPPRSSSSRRAHRRHVSMMPRVPSTPPRAVSTSPPSGIRSHTQLRQQRQAHRPGITNNGATNNGATNNGATRTDTSTNTDVASDKMAPTVVASTANPRASQPTPTPTPTPTPPSATHRDPSATSVTHRDPSTTSATPAPAPSSAAPRLPQTRASLLRDTAVVATLVATPRGTVVGASAPASQTGGGATPASADEWDGVDPDVQCGGPGEFCW